MYLLITPRHYVDGRARVLYGMAQPKRSDLMDASIAIRIEGDALKNVLHRRDAAFVRYDDVPGAKSLKREEDIQACARWRDDVDSDRICCAFDLALGWFTGRGYSHEEATEAAAEVRRLFGED